MIVRVQVPPWAPIGDIMRTKIYRVTHDYIINKVAFFVLTEDEVIDWKISVAKSNWQDKGISANWTDFNTEREAADYYWNELEAKQLEFLNVDYIDSPFEDA